MKQQTIIMVGDIEMGRDGFRCTTAMHATWRDAAGVIYKITMPL